MRRLKISRRNYSPRRTARSVLAVTAILLAALPLAGCAGDGASGRSASAAGIQGTASQTLSLSFSTEPAVLTGGGSSTLKLDVSEKTKPVKGASVVFEIWPQGEDQHAQLSAKTGDEAGSYYVKGEFSQLGSYYLLAHVTTPDGVHDMRTFEFEVK